MISQIINYLPVIVALLVFIIAYKLFARCMRKADKVVEKFEEDDDDDEEENKSDEELFKELKTDIRNAKNKLSEKTLLLNDRIDREFNKLMDKYDSIENASKREEDSDRRNAANEEQNTRERLPTDENEDRSDRRDDGTDNPEKEQAMRDDNNGRDMKNPERRSSSGRSSRRQPVDREDSDNEDNFMGKDSEEVVESFVEGISSCTTANCYTYA